MSHDFALSVATLAGDLGQELGSCSGNSKAKLKKSDGKKSPNTKLKTTLYPLANSKNMFSQRSNQDTFLTHRPAVIEGEWVEAGDLLADAAASSEGELSLGSNVLIAYMPWEGYNYEDAILISERLVFDDVYTSVHLSTYSTDTIESSLGPEIVTCEIPGISESERARLDQNGIIRIGSWVTEGQILVGKVLPINKRSRTSYQKLLYTILKKEFKPVKDSSMRVLKGLKGRIIDIKLTKNVRKQFLPKSSKTILKQSKNKVKINNEHSLKEMTLGKSDRTKNFTITEYISSVRLCLAEKRKIRVGDKMAGRHGNKGIVSLVLPRQDMPFLPDGTPIDIVLNPLGVPSRMNVGQIYECLLGLSAAYLGETFRIVSFDETYGAEASRSLAYSKLFEARKRTGQKWLFNPDFPGKIRLFDGRTGTPFDQPVTVGKAYMLKLVHLVDDKIHARSVGPYSLVTQQPLRGRSSQGGQRLGEMEVWAIEAYGAAFVLLEMLTIKSDDLTGRMNLWSNIIFQKEIKMGTPESFKVLVCELQALCLDIGLFKLAE
uniref:DNA-directed RNA polymerase n=1 Tax=Johansenicoccus eremophilus TaxID=3068301 RepID=A0AA49R0W9_9CHLO|nr:RNA polymerase subunit beta 2 [Chlorophyceae sp. KF-2023a]